MPIRLLGVLLFVLLVPEWALATTYWYRPGFNSMRNPLTYGTGTGLSKANARAGFAGINAGTQTFAPDDIICLSNETYYGEQFAYQTNAVSGTAGHPITIRGCDAVVSADGHTSTGKALFWSVSDLTGDRSYTAAKTPINGAAYAWVTAATDIYKKKIDRRPYVLWEDTTWLEPYLTGAGTTADNRQSIDALSEATIIATLPVGKWGNKSNGDGTVTIYYHATAPGKNPTNTTIRANAIPLDRTFLVSNVHTSYITFEDIEVRGHMSQGYSFYALTNFGASHATYTRLLFRRNHVGLNIMTTFVDMSDIVLNDVDILNSQQTGLQIRGGAGRRTDRITVNRGKFNDTNGGFYNGTSYGNTDGDGIGFGYQGGTNSDYVFNGPMEANGNFNYGAFYGTSYAMQLTNLTMKSVVMSQNRRGCFGEGITNKGIHGTVLFSGWLCARSGDFTGLPAFGTFLTLPPPVPNPAMHFVYGNPVARTVILENITFVGGKYQRLRLDDDANVHYHLKNIVFSDNPGGTSFDAYGDVWVLSRVASQPLNANDTFDHLFFSSAINQHKQVGRTNVFNSAINVVNYYYDVPSDLTAFTTNINCTNCVFNVDPLLVSSTDYHPQATSPLRDAGAASANCIYADGSACDSTPDIGAYPFSQSASAPNITTTTLPACPLTKYSPYPMRTSSPLIVLAPSQEPPSSDRPLRHLSHSFYQLIRPFSPACPPFLADWPTFPSSFFSLP